MMRLNKSVLMNHLKVATISNIIIISITHFIDIHTSIQRKRMITGVTRMKGLSRMITTAIANGSIGR